MEKELTKKSRVLSLLKYLLFAYVLTGVLLMILAFIMYRTELSEGILNICIIVIYVFSSFVVGRLSGRGADKKKYLSGLVMGILYYGILLLISLAVNHTLSSAGKELLTVLVVCGGSGMLGGMLS